MTTEIWKELKTNWEISSWGRIKTKERQINRGNHTFSKKAGFLKLGINKQGYVRVSLSKTKQYLVHRLVLEVFTGKTDKYVDHINGNRHDNRLENLRWCNQSTNAQNQRRTKRTDSNPYTGVSKLKNNKYRCYIVKDYKQIFLGTFKNPEEAANKYNEEALKIFGSQAHLNTINKNKL
jgi:hypothetical protein